MSKLRTWQIEDIRNSKLSAKELGIKHKTTKATVSKIKKGKLYRSVPVIWTLAMLLVVDPVASEPIYGAWFRVKVTHSDYHRSAATLGGAIDSLDHGAFRFVPEDTLIRLVSTGPSVRRDNPKITIYCTGDTVMSERFKTTSQGQIHLDVFFKNDVEIDGASYRMGELAGYACRDVDALVTCVWDVNGVLQSISAVSDAEFLPLWIYTTGATTIGNERWLTCVATRLPPQTQLFIEPDVQSMEGNYKVGSITQEQTP